MFQQSLLFLLLLGNFQYFQSAAFIWCYCFPFMKKINSGDLIKIDLKTQASNCKYQAIWNLAFFGLMSFANLEKAMAPHSSTLAWKIPWTEEPGRLQSMGSRRVGHDWVTSLSLFTFMYRRRKWQPTPVFLPGESQGLRRLVGWWPVSGVAQESDTTEATWQQ